MLAQRAVDADLVADYVRTELHICQVDVGWRAVVARDRELCRWDQQRLDSADGGCRAACRYEDCGAAATVLEDFACVDAPWRARRRDALRAQDRVELT